MKSKSKMKKIIYGMLSIVFVIFSIPFNLLEDFLPKFEIMATNQYDSYQEAYRDLLIDTYGLNTSNVKFSLAYIDNDDIPELIIGEDSSHASGVHIYGFHNNQLNHYFDNSGYDYFGSNGSIHYVEKNGIIVSDYAGMGVESLDIYEINSTKMDYKHTYYVEYDTLHLSEYWNTDDDIDYNNQYFLYYDNEYYNGDYREDNIISYEEFKIGLSQYGIKDATINSDFESFYGGYDQNTNLTIVSYETMYSLNQSNLDSLLYVDNNTPVTNNDLFSEVISQYKDDTSASYSLIDYTFDGNLDLIILHGENQSVRYYELYIAIGESYSYIGQISAMHTTLYFDKYGLYTTASFLSESPNQLILQYYIDNLNGEVLMNKDIPNDFYDKYGYYDLNNMYYKVNFEDISKYTFKEVKATNPIGGMTLDEYLELLYNFNSSQITTTTTPTIQEYTYQTFTDDTDVNDIINTIIANKNIWFDDSIENDAKITFLDIDFDGDLEFIVADNQGSGYYTYTDYYKVTKNSIKKMSVSNYSVNDYTILPDILGENSIQLYLIDNTLKYTAIDIEKYNSSENNEKQLEFYFDSTSNSICISMYYMIEKLSSKTIYYDNYFNKIDEASYNSLKKDFSSTHKDSNNLNLKYKWVSVEEDTSILGKNLLEAYNTFSYDKSLDTDFEDISIPDESFLYTDGDYQYMIINGFAVIGKYTGKDKNVSIPETLGGYTVIAIGGVEIPENDYQLEGAFEFNEDIISVTMPNTIKYINNNSFMCCSKLEEVTFSTKLQIIGYTAFYNCKSLGSIDLSSTGVTTIMGEAFKDCESLASVEFPNLLQEIYQEAFANCPKLANVHIPKSVTLAGEKSFGFVDNSALENFTMYIHYFSPYYDYCNTNDIKYEWIFDTYEEYCTGTHYYFSDASHKYIYQNYADSDTIYADIYNMMDWDNQYGALSTAHQLSFKNDLIHFKFKQVVDDINKSLSICNLTEDDAYTVILAQFILDSNQEDILFEYQKDFAIQLLNIANAEKSGLNTYLDVDSIKGGIDDIKNAKDVTSIFGDSGILSNVIKNLDEKDIIGFVSDVIIEPELQCSKDTLKMLYTNSIYYAIQEICSNDYSIVEKIKNEAESQNIEALSKAADRILKVLISDNISATINEFNIADNETIQNNKNITVISNLFGNILSTFVSKLGPFGKVYSIVSGVISISSEVYNALGKTEEVELNIGYFLLCGQVHEILYNILNDSSKILQEEPILKNAMDYHTSLMYYKRIDLMAYEYASKYLSLFIENNMSIKAIAGMKVEFIINPLSVTINEIQYTILANKLGYNDSINPANNILECWNDISNYYQGYLDRYASKISGEDLQCCSISVKLLLNAKNWLFDTYNNISENMNNTLQQIIVTCPTNVEVYNSDNELIATLSDDGVECEWSYRHYFMVLEELDENDNPLNTKAKVLLLPENYTYKLIATDTGSMSIYHQVIDYSNTEPTLKLEYNFKDIPLNKGDTFEINQQLDEYILKNTITGENYTSLSSSTKSVLHSKKSLIIIISIVVVIIIIIILIFKSKNNKKKNKYSYKNNQDYLY